jgi:PIN domain nuclease of toxin-antitoxin system
MPYVTDTHALVWYMTDDRHLSTKARQVFVKVDGGRDYIFVPCIVFFEMLYLTEKRKIPIDFDRVIEMVFSSQNYRVEPLCVPIIEKSSTIPRESVSDPWDRLIAATSLHLEVPLITRDRSLRRIGIETIW